MTHKKVALITGTSSGIGRATAELLVKNGFTVFGTSRTPESYYTLPYPLLPLDVRSDTSVTAVVRSVIEQAGRIDILINNAGYVQSGAIEENSIADIQAQLDTNLFGSMRLIKAVLPFMRQQGSGRIINVGSVVGWVAPPYIGIYATSKFALEGLSEALRYEVQPFNIHVSLIEPGFVKTNIKAQLPINLIADYALRRQAAQQLVQTRVEQGMDPDEVAQTILQVAKTARPYLHYQVGRSARLLILLKRFLPEPLFERARSRIFNTNQATITAPQLQAS